MANVMKTQLENLLISGHAVQMHIIIQWLGVGFFTSFLVLKISIYVKTTLQIMAGIFSCNLRNPYLVTRSWDNYLKAQVPPQELRLVKC